MKILNQYDLFLKINNTEIEVDPANLLFSLNYSIYDSIPNGIMSLTDTTGMLQEFLLTTPGTNVLLKFGYEDRFITGDMFIRNDILPDTMRSFTMSGDVELPLAHRWIKNQVPKSVSYEGRISDIISLLSSYREYKDFSKITINDTENDNYWYQGLQKDYEFIQNVLLPRSKSRNAQGTPFYFYINEQNEYHFRNYKSLIENKAITDLYYIQETDNKEPTSERKNNIIFDISKKHKDFFENKNKYRVNHFLLSPEDGTVSNFTEELSSVLNKRTNKVPFKQLETTSSTQVLWWGKNQDPQDIEGQQRFFFRDSYQQDRFVVITPFNLDLCIGKTINLFIYTYGPSDEEARTLSQYSGKYLIEKTNHIYDGFNQEALTKCVISRPYGNLLNNKFILKEELL